MVRNTGWMRAAVLVVFVASVGLAQTRTSKPLPKLKAIPKAKAVSADTTVADTIVLKDGKTLVGQVVESRGGTVVAVRRDWAAKNLPEWSAKWEMLEKIANAVASAQRRDRLTAWRRDRGANSPANNNDAITSWLDRELAKPATDAAPAPLMLVRLSRTEIKTTQRRGEMAARMMRLAWTIGLADAETLAISDVKSAIEGRGLIANADTPVSLDSLLPLAVESDGQWALRRAATELIHDTGVRFIRYGSAILPEPTPGEAPNLANAGAALSSILKDLLGEAPTDPLPPVLHSVSSKGRTGAMVTRLEMSPDFSSVSIEVVVYVYTQRSGWTRGPSRSGTLRTGDVPPDDVNAIAEDPQVKSAFATIESVGVFQVNDAMKRQSLAVGATTQRVLRMARATLARDLASVAISLEDSTQKPQSR